MICRDCPKELSAKNKSGYCAKCVAGLPHVRAKKGKITPEQREARRAAMAKINADQAIIARRNATMAEIRKDSEWVARLSASRAATVARLMQDPAEAEKMRESGRRLAQSNRLRLSSPEARERHIHAKRQANLSWCPEALWPLNAKLKAKGYRLPARKEIILSDVPGTIEHARRTIANTLDAQRIKQAREKEQAY